jgi:hypothetical protein
MLCYRCEHRAKFLEEYSKQKLSGKTNEKIEDFFISRPRYECGMIESSVNSCYLFKPVKPIFIKPQDNDNRPLSLNIFSCRVEKVDDIKVELELKGEVINNSVIYYWVPKNNE